MTKLNSKPNILFVSSYLSAINGSLCVSEKLAGKLDEEGFVVKLVSRKKKKVSRLLDIVWTILNSDATCFHIDIYSGQAFIIAEVASLLGKWLNKKMIFTLHGGALPDFYPKNSKRIKSVFDKANIITTPSKMLKQFFQEKGFNIFLIPNSLDLNHFPFDRTNIKPCSLLWVRAFDPIYNPQLAIQTLVEVRKTYSKATLTMVGPDKGNLKDVEQLILENGLEEQVTITGPVPNTELYRFYQTHSVILNTTSYESFGMAVMEAAACGIPIVSTPVGELSYIWSHRHDALLTKSLDFEEMASYALELFGNQELCNMLSVNAYKKAITYDWDYIKPEWVKLFS